MTTAGMEKFSHLEDKIYRTVELCSRLRMEKEQLERDNILMRAEMAKLSGDKERAESQVQKLLAERDSLRLKVEAMLDAVAVLEMENEMKR
jgi:FtsZ-binding cell division protein ZapB